MTCRPPIFAELCVFTTLFCHGFPQFFAPTGRFRLPNPRSLFYDQILNP